MLGFKKMQKIEIPQWLLEVCTSKIGQAIRSIRQHFFAYIFLSLKSHRCISTNIYEILLSSGHENNWYSLTPYTLHIRRSVQYGNTGCRFFKWGVQNWKDVCLKINIPRKLLNFENWCNGEVSKIGH